MLKRRLIPVVMMRHGRCVQSKRFQRYQLLGNPVTIVERLSSWAADELIYLDISPHQQYDLGRDDSNFANHADITSIIREVAVRAFMPLTVGGHINSLQDCEQRLAAGADKLTVNRSIINDPAFVRRAVERFGSQCIVASIDSFGSGAAACTAVDGRRTATGLSVRDHIQRAVDLGVGEILLNCIDRDGARNGYDLELIAHAVDCSHVPVIALGGVGSWDHLAEGIDAGADAVAAANIFHHSENSVREAKRHLVAAGHPVRPTHEGAGHDAAE